MTTTEVFAKTLYGEGRDQGVEGLILIGMVIVNRAASPKWWGATLKEVCLKPKQFSCWNDPKSANYIRMVEAWENRYSDPDMKQIMWICDGVLLGHIKKTGAYKTINHYCRTDVVQKTAWARGVTPVIVHKDHSFFAL